MENKETSFDPSDLHAVLLAADDIVAETDRSEKTDDDISKMLMRLCMLAYAGGTSIAKKRIMDIGRDSLTNREMMDIIVQTSYNMWKTIVQYADDIHNIGITPLLFFPVLKELPPPADTPEMKQMFLDSIDDLYTKEASVVQHDVEGLVQKTPKQKVQNEGKALLREYFAMIRKLKVFHQNREDYETEQEKHIHDRILALYNKIIETNAFQEADKDKS